MADDGQRRRFSDNKYGIIKGEAERLRDMSRLKRGLAEKLPSLKESRFLDKLAELEVTPGFSLLERKIGKMAILTEMLYQRITPGEGRQIAEQIGRLAMQLESTHQKMDDRFLSSSTRGMEDTISNRRRVHEFRFK